jgi:hypothetical protein
VRRVGPARLTRRCRARIRISEQRGQTENIHWRDAKCWIVPPVAVSCDLLGAGGGAGLELLIGYTRLGNLLALLDREEVPEIQKHLVWVGQRADPA